MHWASVDAPINEQQAILREARTSRQSSEARSAANLLLRWRQLTGSHPPVSTTMTVHAPRQLCTILSQQAEASAGVSVNP